MLLRALLAVTLDGTPPSSSVGIQPGVVLEEVDEGGAADLAGLRPGDVLLTWC
jgi:S1-C subfamily serine protease